MGAGTRQSPRFAVELAVELRRGATTAARGRTSNVSRGGLCAVVDAAIERGATVELEMALVFDEASFSEPLAVAARVVWVTQLGPQQHQVGVAFLSVPAAQRTYLDMFMRYLEEGAAAGDGPAEDDPFE